MRLFIVENPECEYDSIVSVLVRAETPEEALRIAMENPDPERGWEWRSIGRAPLKLTTREVENSGPGVLHVDHLHG